MFTTFVAETVCLSFLLPDSCHHVVTHVLATASVHSAVFPHWLCGTWSYWNGLQQHAADPLFKCTSPSR